MINVPLFPRPLQQRGTEAAKSVLAQRGIGKRFSPLTKHLAKNEQITLTVHGSHTPRVTMYLALRWAFRFNLLFPHAVHWLQLNEQRFLSRGTVNGFWSMG